MTSWLDPGLQHLLRLRLRAAGRMGLAKARTPTGLLALFAMVIFLGTFVAARFWLPQRATPGDAFDAAGPLIMAMFWATHVGLRGGGELLGFLPDEVDQLFAAPYHQDQLLRYKLSLLVVAWSLTAVFMTPVATLYSRSLIGGVLAAALILPFLQLSSMCVAMIRERPTGGGARFAYVAIPVAVFVAAAMVDIRDIDGLVASARSVVHHPVGQVVLLPFVAAVGLLTATEMPQLARHASIMLLVNATLAMALLRLGDRAWLENAADGAAAMRARFEKAQSGGLGQLGSVWKVAVPSLPYLWGVGPVAWRRLVEVVRRPATTISLAALVGLVALLAVLLDDLQNTERKILALTLTGAAVGWGVMLIPSTLRLDFRADLDRMDHLLALPLPAIAVVLGQILPMVLLLSLTEWVILLGLTIWAPAVAPWTVVAMATVPFLAWLVLAVENLFFLLLPVRIEAGEAALQSVGTNLLVTFGSWTVQGIVSAAIVGSAAGIGVFTGSMAIATLVAVVGFSIASMICTVLAAWCFRNFDPSRDVPG